VPPEIPSREIRRILVSFLTVAVPVGLTLATVRVPVAEMHTVDSPTPSGYTVSLLIFLVPVLAVAGWHGRHAPPTDRKAFFRCVALMAGLGAFLDFFFGYSFFEFPNQGATLGIRLPAWSWADLRWIPDYLPIEEFGFYIFGALFMLSAYTWADHVWLRRYDPDEYADVAEEREKVLHFSPTALGVWAGLVASGVLYRYSVDGGFPGYFVFLMTAGLLPSLVLVKTVKHFVNWHALAFAFSSLVLISIVWEATLGLPYEWWIYRPDQMLGIYIHAWGGLPVEEVSLWLVGVWDAVLFYELFRVVFYMDRTPREALLGSREG